MLQGKMEKSLAPHFRYLYILVKFSWDVSSPGWTSPNLSASARATDVPTHLSSSQSWTGLVPVSLFLSCTEDPRSGPSSPDVFNQDWVADKDHSPLPAGEAFPNAVQDTAGHVCNAGTLLACGQFAD